MKRTSDPSTQADVATTAHSASRDRIDLGPEGSLQVARALSRPPRAVLSLVKLFEDGEDSACASRGDEG